MYLVKKHSHSINSQVYIASVLIVMETHYCLIPNVWGEESDWISKVREVGSQCKHGCRVAWGDQFDLGSVL